MCDGSRLGPCGRGEFSIWPIMHEMALTESIVDIASDAAKKQGAEKVRRVFVEVGTLSHVEPDALQFCFAAVSAGTIAQGLSSRSTAFPAGAGASTAARPCRSPSGSPRVRSAAAPTCR